MSGQLVTVATFPTPVEAELARQRLQRDGIPACLGDEQTGTVLGLTTGGLSSVKVLVSATDRDRAETILASTEHLRAANDEEVGTWPCPQCGAEVSAEFDVCWSCGTSVDGQTDPNFVREADDPPQADDTAEDEVPAGPDDIDGEPDRESPPVAAPAIDVQADNPYRAPVVSTEPAAAPIAEPPLGDTTDGDEIAARAWRAAVLSTVLCPPLLTVYSVWLVLKIAFADHPLSAAGMRKFYGAMAVNVLVWVLAVLVWLRFFWAY